MFHYMSDEKSNVMRFFNFQLWLRAILEIYDVHYFGFHVRLSIYCNALFVKHSFPKQPCLATIEKCTLKNANSFWNTKFFSHLETSGGQSPNLCLYVVHFFNTSFN